MAGEGRGPCGGGKALKRVELGDDGSQPAAVPRDEPSLSAEAQVVSSAAI